MSLGTTVSLTKEYDPSIYKIFFNDTYKPAKREYTSIAKVMPAPAGKSYKESELSGLGAFVEKPEGKGITFLHPAEGNEVTRTYTTYAGGFQITEEANEDDYHGNWKKMPAELAKGAVHKQETVFWDLFNSGFATHTAWDGQYIFDASGRTVLLTSAAQNNRPSVDASLSETALQAAFEYFYGLVDSSGRPIDMSGDILLIPKELIWSANVLTKTQAKPGAMDNDINTIKDYTTLKVMPCRYLTSTTAWFLLSRDFDARFLWKRNVKLQSADDFSTGNALYKATERFTCFVNNPIGGYGTTGA